MASKVKVSTTKKAPATQAVAARVNSVVKQGHDFMGHGRVAKKIFTILCNAPVAGEEVPAKVLTGSTKEKMQFVTKITKGDDRRNQIREYAKILLDPDTTPTEKNSVKIPTIKPFPIAKLRAAALKLVLAQTAQSRIGLPTDGTDKASRAERYLSDRPFGCQTDLIRAASAAYLGLPLKNVERHTFDNYKMFGMIRYEGETIMITDPDSNNNDVYGLTVSNDRYDIDEHDEVRPASDEQCNTFISKLKEPVLRHYFGFLEVA